MNNEFLNGFVKLISGKEDLISSIENQLVTDFEKKLFEASINNLLDAYNPLRFNNFSYAVRELVRNVLSRLSPDELVINCRWYRNEMDRENGITRKQRIIYSIQGGLSDEYVSSILDVNPLVISNNIRDVIDNLSKHTHIQEETLDIAPDKQEEYVNETLVSVVNLFETINKLKTNITEKLIEDIDQGVVNEAISETIQAIDEIASHSYVDEIETEEIFIESIDNEFINIQACGTVYAELQWGSNSDIRKGDGAILQQNFPFTCDFKTSIEAPETILNEYTELNVSNEFWYKDRYDER